MQTVGKRVLLVDDDATLVRVLSLKLNQAGYQIDHATDADDGYDRALRNNYDGIVLDVMMPKRTGLEVCASLRAHGVLTPVLFLSGTTDKKVIVQGLRSGADDYLTKPFASSELVARIGALLRRNQRTFDTQVFQSNGVQLDIAQSLARYGTKSISLTTKEVLLLKRLMAESPKLVSRLMLLQDVWGIGSSHASNRLDVYIRRLRMKLEELTGDRYIHTLRARGYYFHKPRD